MKYAILLTSLFTSFTLFAQTRLSSGVGLSHTGYNGYLEAGYQWQAHEVMIGPKLLLSDSSVPMEGPWGMRFSYRYTVLKKNRFSGFAQLAYQLTWLQVYNPNNLPNGENNRIHEGHFLYGFSFDIDEHWRVSQSLGVGAYVERLVDLIGETVQWNNGFSAWAGIELGYRF